ncbi:hypothetical protein A5734_03670 [Mycolicibacterium fortuitum]|nr:hypothetical protein A5734_03670 [Mycolicibacterium fortuitum]
MDIFSRDQPTEKILCIAAVIDPNAMQLLLPLASMSDSDARDQRCGGSAAERHHIQQAFDLLTTETGRSFLVFRLNATLD